MTPPAFQTSPSEPVTVFLCYAEADTALRDELEKHLAPLVSRGLLHLWHDGKLAPGSDTEHEAFARLESARVVLALVTVDLLVCERSIPRLAHAREQGKTVVPILAKPCLWQLTELGHLSPLPPNKRAVSLWTDVDAAWTEIAEGIFRTLTSPESATTLSAPQIVEPSAVKPPTPRVRWLRMMIHAARRRRALTGLTAGGLRVDLDAVRVPVRVTLDQQRTVFLPPLDEQLVKARAGTRLVLVGDVGMGKSELLYETCARLAERALESAEAPVPVIVRARDLAAGFKAALLAMWPMAEDLVPAVLASPGKLVLLVDGLDEAGLEAPDQIEALADSLGERCHAVVVASRPVLRFRELHADERWLVRWSPLESDRFLALWAKHRPEAVQRLSAARSSVPPELLENPLTASMCLLVAEREQEALKSRVAVFRAVVRRLVDDWFVRRNMPDAPVGEVLAGLETLALEVVSGGAESITEGHLRRVLGPVFGSRGAMAIETAESHLGLLVRRASGDFDFALRSLAEHLAGRALLSRGDAEIVAASKTVWGAEAVRHAVGLASIDDAPSVPAAAHRASDLIEAILEGEEDDDIVFTNRNLRGVLAAVRAATDLPRIRISARDRLRTAVIRRLWDETSVWVGERVADVVADWVRARPAHAKELILGAFHSIQEPASRASWFAGQSCDDPNVWMLRLAERDVSVRWIVTQRLAPFVDNPAVRIYLMIALKDDGMPLGAQPVALGAGMVLRRAARDEDFSEWLPYLQDLLEHGDGFHQAGAAIALLPGEVDAKKRAFGLCRALGGDGFGVPQAILHEVAADPEGRAELERIEPDWKQKKERGAVEPLPPDWNGLVPASSEVRQRLVGAAAPALGAAKQDLLAKIRASAGLTLPMVACDLAFDLPELICALLRAAPETAVSLHWDPECDKLGRAAVRHEPVRKELLGLWHRIQAMPASERRSWAEADYPGRALEGLIHEGNDEAARVFAEWLSHGHHSIPFRTFGAPLLEGFECPPGIRAAGHAVAQRFFEQTGRAMYFGIAEGLFRLSSFWKHDLAMRQGVEAWLASGDFDQFHAALWALQAIGVTEEAHGSFRQNTGKLVEHIEPDFRWLRILPLLHKHGLLDTIRELVEWFAELDMYAPVAVPLTFSWHGPAERRARSIRVSEQFRLVDFVPEYLATRLVSPAPDVWAKKLEQMVVGASSIVDLLPFIRALPLPLQARVVKSWLPTAVEHPWVRDGLGGRCVRPADKIREILFDLGVEEPVEDPPTADPPCPAT